MAKSKKTRTRLPRLTMLAMSQKELQRFSEAAEQVAGLAHLMVGLMTRLEACVTRLEARTAAAKKAHQTRREKPSTEPPAEDPPMVDGAIFPPYPGVPEDYDEPPAVDQDLPY